MVPNIFHISRITIPGKYSVFIPLSKSKIDLFLENSIGWITIESSNPFISGYYITDFGNGVIGGDHIF